MTLDYKYAERHFLYNAEHVLFRSLSVTTKAYAAYLGKLVHPDGGWLALQGRSPADAFRRNCTGPVTRSDHRLLRRAVEELLEQGYLVLGELDDAGEFLPLGWGDYVAIRDWVPAKQGMSRREATSWHAEREARAAEYRARLVSTSAEATAAALSPGARPEGIAVREVSHAVPAPPSPTTGSAPTTHRESTDATPTRHRPCTDRSGSSENSNGTEIALFHTIPDQIPPLSPKGESAHADKRAAFPVEPRSRPAPGAPGLAALAVGWLNEQQTSSARFRADSRDAVTQARRWLAAGWDWRLVQTALALRLEALKAAKPDGWQKWATPGTLFNRKLARYVEEAQAGHRYSAADSAPPADKEAEEAAARTQRLIAQGREAMRRDAEAAFRDVLDVVELVGVVGDWESELPDSRARAAVQQIGWAHVVTERTAAHDEFVRRYLGR